jgi:hypothetical protein
MFRATGTVRKLEWLLSSPGMKSVSENVKEHMISVLTDYCVE